jgi:hypothetical protein
MTKREEVGRGFLIALAHRQVTNNISCRRKTEEPLLTLTFFPVCFPYLIRISAYIWFTYKFTLTVNHIYSALYPECLAQCLRQNRPY